MAGILIEPAPRLPPGEWQPFLPDFDNIEPLAPPWDGQQRTFQEVVRARRSAISSAVAWPAVGNLLWHAFRPTGPSALGRAGMTTEQRANPSAGGLHSILPVCIAQNENTVRIYEPNQHAFISLSNVHPSTSKKNESAVHSVTGRSTGCTIRFISDFSKMSAAYVNPESLLLRDSGALLATICFYAEWLGLSSCPLGFLGQDLVPDLGLPNDRFVAVGAVQISSAS